MKTYEPTLVLPLRLKERPDPRRDLAHDAANRDLWLIYAADGTPLDVIDTSTEVTPIWAEQLPRLLPVNVTPAEWGSFRDNCRTSRPVLKGA